MSEYEGLTPDEMRALAEQVFEDGDELTAVYIMDLADAQEHDAIHDVPDMTPTGEGDDTDPTLEELGFHYVTDTQLT